MGAGAAAAAGDSKSSAEAGSAASHGAVASLYRTAQLKGRFFLAAWNADHQLIVSQKEPNALLLYQANGSPPIRA